MPESSSGIDLCRHMNIYVIINPAAGHGRGRRMRPLVEAALAGRPGVSIAETRASGDETQLAAAAIRSSADRILIVGGDGTCSRVAEVLVGTKSSSALCVVPCGTGNDFAKTLGLSHLSASDIARLVSHGEPTRIDVGRADGHVFINSCGFGFDPSVLEATQSVRFLNGDAVYIYSALAQLFSYRGLEVRLNGARPDQGQELLMAVASNGRSLGGAFRIAPSASATDGKLDFCFVADTGVFGRLRVFVGALRGTHLDLPGVTNRKEKSLALTFAEIPAIEMDGELRRATSHTVTIECVPKALAVVAAPDAPL